MKLSNVMIIITFVGCLFFSITSVNAVQHHQRLQQKNVRHTMKFNNYVYIFLGPGLNPTQSRTTIKTDQFTFTAIGIDFQHKDDVIKVAKEAIANGAQLIELCGGFGPIWIAKVSEAINGQVPVGSVAYGPEARKPLLDLLSSK